MRLDDETRRFAVIGAKQILNQACGLFPFPHVQTYEEARQYVRTFRDAAKCADALKAIHFLEGLGEPI